MSAKLEYPAMPKPAEQCEPETTPWAMSLSFRIESAMESADEYSIKQVVICLSELFADERKKLPWDVLPSEDRAWRSAAPWIHQVFRKDWSIVEPLIREHDSRLADRISARLNVGGKAEAGSMKGKGGEASDNVTSYERGNSRPYTLNRLERARPDLFERVIDGELSANAAAIQAGFRKPTITVRLEPEAIASTLKKKLTPEQCRELAELLVGNQMTG